VRWSVHECRHHRGDCATPITERFCDLLSNGLPPATEAVVVDLHLGDEGSLTGLDLLHWVAEHYPDVRLILSTAASVTADMKESVHVVLRKPYTIDDLHRALHAVG
jgi:ActR/RegA family two-component response regulator